MISTACMARGEHHTRPIAYRRRLTPCSHAPYNSVRSRLLKCFASCSDRIARRKRGRTMDYALLDCCRSMLRSYTTVPPRWVSERPRKPNPARSEPRAHRFWQLPSVARHHGSPQTAPACGSVQYAWLALATRLSVGPSESLRSAIAGGIANSVCPIDSEFRRFRNHPRICVRPRWQ